METNVIEGPEIPAEILENWDSSIYQTILNNVNGHLDSVCMTDAVSGEKFIVGSIISYSEILALKLQSLGCKPGHVIGIICENRHDYLAFLLSIFKIGATAACFSPLYSTGELEHTLNITKPFVIFSNSYVFEKLDKINQKYKSYEYLINVDEVSMYSPHMNSKSFVKYNEEYKYAASPFSGDYTALILFSSGSTGLPKGVMLSSRSLIFVVKFVIYAEKKIVINKPPVHLSVIPFFHGYGLLIILRCFLSGQNIIFLKNFNENIFLSSIQRYKVTNLYLVPALMVFLVKNSLVNNFDLSSVRRVVCGAAPLSANIEQSVTKKFKLNQISQGYGLTETTIVCLNMSFSKCYKPGSVGALLYGMKGKVIDPTGKALGPNEEGEICFKGILLMKGYYNDDEATQKAIDKDGWLHTGDIGYYDDDGDFFIVDRIKDLIKYKGFQVAPAELETLLLKHKAIKDVAVIGIPDEFSGEIPKAFVVKQDSISEQEIMDYVSCNVAPYMKLRGGVTFIQKIPRNPNGKILRKDLRKWSQSKL